MIGISWMERWIDGRYVCGQFMYALLCTWSFDLVSARTHVRMHSHTPQQSLPLCIHIHIPSLYYTMYVHSDLPAKFPEVAPKLRILFRASHPWLDKVFIYIYVCVYVDVYCDHSKLHVFRRNIDVSIRMHIHRVRYSTQY